MKNIIFSLTIGAILLFKSLSFNCYAQSDTTFLSKNENKKVNIEITRPYNSRKSLSGTKTIRTGRTERKREDIKAGSSTNYYKT